MALAAGQVVPFDKTGIDCLTDWGRSQTRWHRRFRAEDDRGGHFHHTPAFSALDDLSILQVGRGEALGSRLGSTFAREVPEDRWGAIPMQQGVGIVRQLITGKEWSLNLSQFVEDQNDPSA
jgi:hypothetical protein